TAVRSSSLPRSRSAAWPRCGRCGPRSVGRAANRRSDGREQGARGSSARGRECGAERLGRLRAVETRAVAEQDVLRLEAGERAARRKEAQNRVDAERLAG